MIKVKGQVIHVVTCVTDKTDVIKDLSRTLFTELNKRSNNPVYNLLGDIIGNLSATAGTTAKEGKSAIHTAQTVDSPSPASSITTSANSTEANLRVLTIDEFQDTMSFMLKFVKRDKQGDSLLERILQRFSTSSGILQNRLLAYCIAQLPITEKGIKKIIELFKYAYNDQIYYYLFISYVFSVGLSKMHFMTQKYLNISKQL